jgi:hypothetical protein
VKAIAINGKQSMDCVASRLIRNYFSKEELLAENVTLFGGRRGLNPKFDPVRIDLIKSHLDELNGGPLSHEQWMKCKNYMSHSLNNFKRE